MDQDLEVSVDELVSLLKQKGIPLPFEMGAFIVLEACEQLLESPARLRGQDVFVGAQGEVAVEPVQGASPDEEAVRALLVLLGDLLVCSAPGVPPMLLELATSGPSDDQWTLSRLRDDLEACLLPLNRGATRRVLSRILRELRKTGERASARPSTEPDANALDAELDALLGGGDVPSVSAIAAPRASEQAPVPVPAPNAEPNAEPTPRVPAVPAGIFAPRGQLPVSQSAGSRSASDEASSFDTGEFGVGGSGVYDAFDPESARSGAFDAIDDDQDEPTVVAPPSEPRGRRRAKPAERAVEQRVQPSAASGKHPPVSASDARDEPARAQTGRATGHATDHVADHVADKRARGLRLDDLVENDAERSGAGVGAWIGGFFVFAAALLLVAYFVLGQAQMRRLVGLEPIASEAPAVAAKADKPAHAKVGTLLVSSVPERAQVLLLVGKGPVVVPQLPIGIAHEFIAITDDNAVGRALVPANATWDVASGAPTYELALVATKNERQRQLDLSASLLPRETGSATGQLGSVRVVTAPPGAKVYQLVGFTPSARVEGLLLDQTYEVLIYAPGHEVARRRIDPSTFLEESGQLVSQLEVTLEPASRR